MYTKSSMNERHRQVFEMLKSVFTPYKKDLIVLVDQPDTYYVDIPEGTNGKSYFFGAVQIRHDFVTFHFAGLPQLKEILSFAYADFCIVHATSGGNFFVFKKVRRNQLRQLTDLVHDHSGLSEI